MPITDNTHMGTKFVLLIYDKKEKNNNGFSLILRWFETVSSTFQDLEFDGSL